MGLLPDLDEKGHLILDDETDDQRLQPLVDMVRANHPSAYTKFCHAKHNLGKSTRGALEYAGISICER